MRAERDHSMDAHRVAIVTGGSLGIGGSISRELGDQGYAVSISYLGNTVAAATRVDSIHSSRGVALAVRADLADELDVERLFAETAKAFLGVDVVVHALALATESEVGLQVANRSSCLHTLRLVNREAGRRLRAGGAVVNLCRVTDATTTSAVGRVTRALSHELHDRDITVNALAVPFEEPDRCEAAVDLVSFLVGEGGRGINGQLIRLDEPGHAPGATPGATSRPGRDGRHRRPPEVSMTTTDPSTEQSTPGEQALDLRLEIVVLPVADVDRAKDFYTTALRCRLDADFTTDETFRVVQVTPPGSACSIIFGQGLTAATPGTTKDLMFVVDDIERAHDELVARGVAVSDVFHDVGGVFHHAGTEGRVPGPDPERRSYCSFVSFDDPDGNGWLIQEITTRLPGR